MNTQVTGPGVRLVDHPPIPPRPPGQPQWTAFFYRLPTVPSRVRVGVWRALGSARALNLRPSVWAVGHPEGIQPDLEEIFEKVTSAGGEAWTFSPEPGSAEWTHLEANLARACEELWVPFRKDLQRVDERLGTTHLSTADPPSPSATAPTTDPPSPSATAPTTDSATTVETVTAAWTELRRIRRRYGLLRSRDLVASDAGAQAADALNELTSSVGGNSPFAPTGSHLERAVLSFDDGNRRAGRREVVKLASWGLEHDVMRTVATMRPFPDLGWEREFNEFERWAYISDDARTVLRHGVFEWSGPADELADDIAHLNGRVRRFEQYAAV